MEASSPENNVSPWRRVWVEAPVLVERSVHVGAEVASEKLGWEVHLLVSLVGLILVYRLVKSDLSRARDNLFFGMTAILDLVDLFVHFLVIFYDDALHEVGRAASMAAIVSVALGSAIAEGPAKPHH